ncbi:actin-associated protein FAM107A isoform X2 [Xenopus tropicalis]|uniref:Actin-associated protein FAM107A isoform X2 n=1 Tax=Xenopus tropicalis TaxID=8364 RepID=A0A8J0R649_XENTR|nr:actin-associated protein FAM107A isoform X2 [Xenopus tropicalis]|eukprot:XP_004916776.1 PREDICTED: protein FAM107B-like isoform X2 [Xenopus tropicalis]
MSQTPEGPSRHAKMIEEYWRMRPPVPPQCRMSQELWMWAKCQVLASLRLPFGIGTVVPTLKKASAMSKEGSLDSVSTSSASKLNPPFKPDNPMKSSRTHQELHRELLVTYKKGLVLHSKPELLQVLEKRRLHWKDGQNPELHCTPLERELQKWQQRREEKEQKSVKNDLSGVHEFLRVRDNLRKSTPGNLQSPPESVS